MHRQWTDATSALVRRLNDLVPTGMTDTPQITPDYRHDQPPAIQKEELLPFTAFSHDNVMFKTKAKPSIPIIYVMKDFKVAIEIDPAVNGNKPMQLQPRELFGFGLGTSSVDSVENFKGRSTTASSSPWRTTLTGLCGCMVLTAMRRKRCSRCARPSRRRWTGKAWSACACNSTSSSSGRPGRRRSVCGTTSVTCRRRRRSRPPPCVMNPWRSKNTSTQPSAPVSRACLRSFPTSTQPCCGLAR